MKLRRLVEFKCGHGGLMPVKGDTMAEIKKKIELYEKTCVCPWCERQQAKEKAEATAKEK